MTTWHYLHLIFLAIWAGVVLTEAVIERAGQSAHSKAVAHFHASIDRYVEAPLLLLVLVSGVMLLLPKLQVGLEPQLLIKIAFGLGAIVANSLCVWAVFKRAALSTNSEDTSRLSLWIQRSAFIGIPLALGAFYLGGQRMHWW